MQPGKQAARAPAAEHGDSAGRLFQQRVQQPTNGNGASDEGHGEAPEAAGGAGGEQEGGGSGE